MALYDYRCPQGHEAELVRAAGTDFATCPTCGDQATRFFKMGYRAYQREPRTDTEGLARRFQEAVAEREYGFAQQEARTGESVPRPNDLAAVQSHVDAKAYHGEFAGRRFARETEFKQAGLKR